MEGRLTRAASALPSASPSLSCSGRGSGARLGAATGQPQHAIQAMAGSRVVAGSCFRKLAEALSLRFLLKALFSRRFNGCDQQSPMTGLRSRSRSSAKPMAVIRCLPQPPLIPADAFWAIAIMGHGRLAPSPQGRWSPRGYRCHGILPQHPAADTNSSPTTVNTTELHHLRPHVFGELFEKQTNHFRNTHDYG